MFINKPSKVILIWLIFSGIWLLFALNPMLIGYSKSYVMQGDNYYYLDLGENTEFLDLLFSPIMYRNLSGMALIAKFTLYFGDYQIYAAALLNFLFLYLSLINFDKIMDKIGIYNKQMFYLLMLINLYFLSLFFSINKEIIGICILSYGVFFFLYGNFIKYFLLAFISFYIRDAYMFSLLLFFIICYFKKIPYYYYLLFISIVLPILIPEKQIDILLEGQDNKSIGLSIFFADLQSYPFGYIFTFLPKLFIQAFGALSPLRIGDALIISNTIGLLTIISSFIIFLLTIILLYRITFKSCSVNKIILKFIYAFTLVTVTPLFLHLRYLFPLYPFLCIAYLSCKPIT